MNDLNEPDPEIIRGAIFEIIENQMRDGTPPETKQTYDRLIADGHSREDTMKMLACVVTVEIFDAMQNGKPHDESRYIAGLHALPELPFEDD